MTHITAFIPKYRLDLTYICEAAVDQEVEHQIGRMAQEVYRVLLQDNDNRSSPWLLKRKDYLTPR